MSPTVDPKKSRSRFIRDEGLRVIFVLLAALWAISPLMTRAEVGAGDARWYEYQVADAVTQFRAGVFPVYVGQSQYAFNGAIHPLRTAPYLQYFAGLIDVVTGRHLTAVVLLHVAVILSFVGGGIISYFALIWLAPPRRWGAAVLSVIYVWAPGVLGLPFAQDLYMSTMAVPWVPLALVAAVQMYRKGGYGVAIVLGGSLGILWWAHSPIAFWTTLAAGVVTIGSVFSAASKSRWIRKTALASVVFLLVASYPIVSVLTLRAGDEKIVPKIHGREELLREVTGAFPGVVEPLSLNRPLLTMMQPGYVALAIFLLIAISIFWCAREGRLGQILLVGVAAGYLILMWPIPGVTRAIWNHIPELIANMTNIWPMQRLAMIVVALVMVAWGNARISSERLQALGLKLSVWLSIGALVWAGWQADLIRSLAHHQTHTLTDTLRDQMPENVNVSAYCYQQLAARPAYFIHGVTDPEMELRLLDPDTGQVVESNRHVVESAATEPWLPLGLKRTANAALWQCPHAYTLRPGLRYLLTFDFSDQAQVDGILRLVGQSMLRVYALPEAGDARGFGIGAGHEKSIVLWTSEKSAETIHLEFINQGEDSADPLPARVRLTEIRRDELPARLESLIPLRCDVDLKTPLVLETPRAYIPGWSAEVNGSQMSIERTREGLVAVKLPVNKSNLTLNYVPALGLRLAFWTSLFAIGALTIGFLIGVIFKPQMQTS